MTSVEIRRSNEIYETKHIFPRNFKLEVFYPMLDVIIFIILEQKLGLSANLAFIRRTDSSSGRRVPINYRC